MYIQFGKTRLARRSVVASTKFGWRRRRRLGWLYRHVMRREYWQFLK